MKYEMSHISYIYISYIIYIILQYFIQHFSYLPATYTTVLPVSPFSLDESLPSCQGLRPRLSTDWHFSNSPVSPGRKPWLTLWTPPGCPFPGVGQSFLLVEGFSFLSGTILMDLCAVNWQMEPAHFD